MDHTQKYHLPQWKEDDPIRMDDFNQMCLDIEAGIEAARTDSLTPVLAQVSVQTAAATASMDVSRLDLTGYQYLLLDLYCTQNIAKYKVLLRVNGLKTGYWVGTFTDTASSNHLGKLSVVSKDNVEVAPRYFLPVYGKGGAQVTLRQESRDMDNNIPSVTIANLTSFDLAMESGDLPAGTTLVLRGVR